MYTGHFEIPIRPLKVLSLSLPLPLSLSPSLSVVLYNIYFKAKTLTYTKYVMTSIQAEVQASSPSWFLCIIKRA